MNRQFITTVLIVFGLPTIYAIILRIFFGVEAWRDLFEVMSTSFLFCLPTIVGALTVYLSSYENAKRSAYQFFAPWIPIMIFCVLTIAFAFEGWACWLMILPIFLIAATLGGFLGGYLKRRQHRKNLKITVLVLIPFFLAPLESFIGSIPGTYTAYTFIDIDARSEEIWENVTRVKEISEQEDTGHLNSFLGFPRPVKAELNYQGEGAYRKAIFTNGLVFHETVTEYSHQSKMVFNIEAYPHEIPSTTLDEHVVIGGDYFDVLTGTYELEKLDDGKHRLHLYSTFQVNTTFNFYAGMWAKWIMEDIQNNILRVQKKRSEE